jgi:hypothetical protein
VPLAPVAEDTQAYRTPTRQECYVNAGTTFALPPRDLARVIIRSRRG